MITSKHEQLRFIQRVLESEATAYDREIAAEMVRKMRRDAQPAAADQPVSRITAAEAKKLSTQFFYWWHNQPGSNTEQGFDEWWAQHGAEYAAAPADDQPADDLPVPVIKPGCEMAEGWSVTVESFGKLVLNLSHTGYCGVPDIDQWESTIRGCAHHLLSFIGAPADDQARRDAERYRHFISCGFVITFLGVDYRDKETLDSAIDRSMAASAAEGDGDA